MKMKYKLAGILVAAIVALAVLWWLVSGISQSEVTLDVNQEIDLTPEQITSIEAIGEWELLAIANEELVDTTRKGFFKDDHLVRIYYGTVRLGIDMKNVEQGWLHTVGDSIVVTLPQPGLLDKNFIDEARTKSFFESGKWSHQDRDKLYQKAYRQMLAHCLTPENLRSARENGEALFTKMMKNMGYERVSVRWK
ncbi:MAG: DUF4230 domain-containing protein [Prevotella sp.]|jgi:hypothetical protein|nr:DUF4230 domain-containing protein [Prevotella sp.]